MCSREEMEQARTKAVREITSEQRTDLLRAAKRAILKVKPQSLNGEAVESIALLEKDEAA